MCSCPAVSGVACSPVERVSSLLGVGQLPDEVGVVGDAVAVAALRGQRRSSPRATPAMIVLGGVSRLVGSVARRRRPSPSGSPPARASARSSSECVRPARAPRRGWPARSAPRGPAPAGSTSRTASRRRESSPGEACASASRPLSPAALGRARRPRGHARTRASSSDRVRRGRTARGGRGAGQQGRRRRTAGRPRGCRRRRSAPSRWAPW